jgi:hypothetical protein
MLAAEKNASAMCGMPVVNMWWTHSPKLRKRARSTARRSTCSRPAGVRANTGRTVETMPAAGRKMM